MKIYSARQTELRKWKQQGGRNPLSLALCQYVTITYLSFFFSFLFYVNWREANSRRLSSQTPPPVNSTSTSF